MDDAKLTRHFYCSEAFGDLVPTEPVRANARALARQLEVLRMVLGGRPIEVLRWYVPGTAAPHPDGEAHDEALAADVRPSHGASVEALATIAFRLGFATVIKLEGGLVHIEIPRLGTARAQSSLTRTARIGRDARVEQASTRIVTADTPILTSLQERAAETQVLLYTLEGFDEALAKRLVALGPAISAASARHGVPAELFTAITIQEGAGRPDAYRSEGPLWYKRNIESGRSIDTRTLARAAQGLDPDQWGSAGAWQMLRSTAVGLGFPAETLWAEKLMVHDTKELDRTTGMPRGAKSGTFRGPFADPMLAADYTGRLLATLLDTFGGDTLKVAAAYNAGTGNVKAAIREGGEQWLEALPSIAKHDAARTYAPNVAGYARRLSAVVDTLTLARKV